MPNGNQTDPVARVHAVIKAILTAGYGAALVIFCLARPPQANPLGYEFTDSKRYLRDMEMFGGKANILTAQFRDWLAGMFQGRSLALTVAILTSLLALGVWIFAMPLPPDDGPEPP